MRNAVIERTVDIPASHRLVLEVPNIPIISWIQKRRWEAKRKAVLDFAGSLKNSPAFEGDTMQIVREMHAEWDRPWDNDEK
jgi:hypothetical protein